MLSDAIVDQDKPGAGCPPRVGSPVQAAARAQRQRVRFLYPAEPVPIESRKQAQKKLPLGLLK